MEGSSSEFREKKQTVLMPDCVAKENENGVTIKAKSRC